jgi:integrase
VELFHEGRWGVLHVEHGWDRVEGEQGPKSEAGKRLIPIPEQLYEILDEHLMRLGRASSLIFGRNAQTPYSYNALRERTPTAWKRANLEPNDLQLHEGRHSYSSFLAAAGIPKERRDRYLGHADHTMDGRYTHQLDPQYLDDAKTLSDYLRRANTPSRLEHVRDSCATVRDNRERVTAVPSGRMEEGE